jgi:hypothetical protein
MKRGPSISFAQLQAAYNDVQRELAAAGLWHEGSRLQRTEVVWCRQPPPDLWDAKGFFVNDTHRVYRTFGCEPGHIYIPSRVLDGGRDHAGSLRDVLRHEFGHALAYYYPGPVRRSRAFVAAFGAGYDMVWIDPPEDPADFVTDYAMTSPMEDFAEAFMVWLRNPANPISSLPRFRQNSRRRPSPSLRAKLRFVRDLCHRLAG